MLLPIYTVDTIYTIFYSSHLKKKKLTCPLTYLKFSTKTSTLNLHSYIHQRSKYVSFSYILKT